MKLGPKAPRLSLRINGTRAGALARPTVGVDAAMPSLDVDVARAAVDIDVDAARPARAQRFGLRVHATTTALSTQRNDYMPDDDEAAS